MKNIGNGNDGQRKRMKVKDAQLVGTLSLTEVHGSVDGEPELKFPVVYYAFDTVGTSTYLRPTMLPGAGAGNVSPIEGIVARILMPTKDGHGQVVISDINARVYSNPHQIEELLGPVTYEQVTKQDLTERVDRAKGHIYNSLDPATVVLNTDLETEAYLAEALFRKRGLLNTFFASFNGGRVDAKPIDESDFSLYQLDLTVERAYSLMKRVADAEQEKNNNNPNYKSHGCWIIIGNGDLEENLTSNMNNDHFGDGKQEKKHITDEAAFDYMMDLIGDDGAVIVGRDGEFLMSGAWVRLPDSEMKAGYREAGLGSNNVIHDGKLIMQYMGIKGRNIGTKHMTAHGITLCSRGTAAIVLSGDDLTLSLFRNGRVISEYSPASVTERYAPHD